MERCGHEVWINQVCMCAIVKKPCTKPLNQAAASCYESDWLVRHISPDYYAYKKDIFKDGPDRKLSMEEEFKLQLKERELA